jgi:hypothetical protein
MPNIFKQGDWGESYMKGMEIARMREQGEIQREQLQAQQAERNMRMEEFKLKMLDQKEKRENALKFQKQIDPLFEDKTETIKAPDPNWQGDEMYPNMIDQTRVTPSPMAQIYGADKAPILRAIMTDPEVRKQLVTGMLKPTEDKRWVVGKNLVDASGKQIFTAQDDNESYPKNVWQAGFQMAREERIRNGHDPNPKVSEIVEAATAIQNNMKPPSSVTVNNTIGTKGMVEVSKEMGNQIVKERPEIEKAALSYKDLVAAEKLLNSPMVTGKGAEWILGAGKVLQQIGFNEGKTAIENTEAYAALMGKQVGQIIKQFGSGTGLSDADREYAEKIAAGKITLEKGSMKKIMAINKKAYTNIIRQYNEKAKQIKSRPDAEELLYDLEVPMPTEQNDPLGLR